MKKPLKELLARIEVKSVKFHRGHDGMQGLNCKLYVDGKFVAHVHDDARGGEFEYDTFIKMGSDGTPTWSRLNMLKFLLDAKEEYDLSYTSYLGDEPLELEHDWDSLVNLKVEEIERKKNANKGVMIKQSNGYTIVGFQYTIPNCIKRWGKDAIVKELQGIYDKKVSEGNEILNADYLESIGVKV